MKQSEIKALIPVAVLGIIAAPFVWLYEKAGWFGLVTLCLAVVGAVVVWRKKSAENDQRAFDDLALYVYRNRLHTQEAKEMNYRLMKSHPARAELIRQLQIMRDSIEIALTSKKRDVAESRMNEVLLSALAVKKKYASLVSPEVVSEITEGAKQCHKEFHTAMYRNIATAHLEKAAKLKTKKSKIKYANLAKETILEGLANERAEVGELKGELQLVENYLGAVEASS